MNNLIQYPYNLYHFVEEELLRRQEYFSSPYVISAVGAGGKTSILESLFFSDIAECRILTTTTNIIAPNYPISHNCPSESGIWLSEVISTASNKHKGISKREFDREIRHRRLIGDDCLFLCEADGAKRKDLKAYAAHEPVIPQTTDLVLLVFGMRILDKDLSEDNVHRAEIFSRWSGLELGKKIAFKDICQAMDSAHYFKDIPPTAKVIAVFNQSDHLGDESNLPSWGRRILANERLDAVFFNSISKKEDLLHEQYKYDLKNHYALVRKRTAKPFYSAVVMAAGLSTRMGCNKLTLEVAGEAVLAHTLRRVAASGVDEIILVCGHEREKIERIAESVKKDLPSDLELRVIFNEDYTSGQGSSVAKASRAISNKAVAAFYVPGDQPYVSPALMRQLMEEHKVGEINIPAYKNRQGSPLLFDKIYFPELAILTGDLGGRQVVRNNLENVRKHPFPLRSSFIDLDEPQDLEKLKNSLNNDCI